MGQPLIFVHLSDIHFQRWKLDGTSYDRDKAIRDELELDAPNECKRIGTPSGILITGDIAFAADVREYKAGLDWLAILAAKLGTPRHRVWAAPGNHDIDRRVTDARLTSLVQEDLRRDPSALPNILADAGCASALFAPLKAYNDHFAGVFGWALGPEKLTWQDDLELNDGSTLRLFGLNSTLTSSRLDEENVRRLVLGDLSPFCPRNPAVAYVSLCHHPPDWLIDGNDADDLLASRFHAQLFGHKHLPRARKHGEMVRISAGATHPERKEKNWIPSYNILKFEVIEDGAKRLLRVRVYTRVWKAADLQFVTDAGDTPDGKPFDVPLSPWTPPSSAPPATGGTPPPNGTPSPAGIESTEAPLKDASKRLTYRFLTLPHHKRMAVAIRLGLVAEDDAQLPDRELFSRFFVRAREQHLLAALWSEVEKEHSDPSPDPNPFDGR